MKKKLLLGAVVVAGLTMGLTSCVDNVESASVTNIRNAKTEQLKSLAALNNANAQAALILANAEAAAQAANQAYLEAQAALLAAQADYEAAQAELIRAQAALLDAQTEAERAKLEYELKLLQAELDKMAQELAAAEAEADAKAKLLEAELKGIEIALQLAQLELQKQTWWFNQMVETALKEAQDAEEAAAKRAAFEAAMRLQYLLSVYEQASTNLVNARGQLALDQMQLLRAQSGLQDTKQGAQAAILNAQKEKDGYEDEIASLNRTIAFWEEWGGKTITVDDVVTARQEWIAALDAEEPLQDAYDAAEEALTEAKETVDGLKTYGVNVAKVIDRYTKYGYRYDPIGDYSYYTQYYDLYSIENEQHGTTEYYKFQVQLIGEEDTSYPSNCRGKYCLLVWRGDISNNEPYEVKAWEEMPAVPVFENAEYKDEFDQNESYKTLADGGKGLDAWNAQMNNSAEYGIMLPIEEAQEALDAAQTAEAESLTAWTEADKNLKKAKDDLKKAEDKVKEKEGKVKEANDALEAFELPKDPTEEELAEALAEQIKLQAAVTAAEREHDAAKDEVKAAEKVIEGDPATGTKGVLEVYTEAQADLWNKRWDVLKAENDVARADGQAVDATKQIEENNQLVADIKAEEPDYVAAMTALTAANENVKEKEGALKEAQGETTAARNKYKRFFAAIYSVWPFTGTAVVGDGGVDDDDIKTAIEKANERIGVLNGLIDACDEVIKNSQKTLDDIEAGVYGEEGDAYRKATGQVLILILENKIAADQVAVDNAQMRFDIAKAELEAELNK